MTDTTFNDDDLADQSCQVVDHTINPFSAKQAESFVKQLSPEWRMLDGKRLRREFKFNSFSDVMVFVNDVAAVADEENHHPDIHVSCRQVALELTTNAVGGLTENDFIMARKVDLLV